MSEVPAAVRSAGTESRAVAARGWGAGHGELVFNGAGVSVLQRGKSSGGGPLHNKVNVLHATKRTRQMVKRVNFMLCAFCHK